ncbi:hypothetical protein U1Q18_047042, partial [Sarracenia purpurea var. burkii]
MIFHHQTFPVHYIQNDSDYLARILHDHCDEQDGFTICIVVLSTRRTPEAKKALNDAFKAAYGGATLKDFVLVDDREKLKQVFGDTHSITFDVGVEIQRHPFQNALRVWSEKNRDPDKTDCISDTCMVGQELENVRYVQHEDTYLAQELHDHCDGKDNWSMWIIILTTRRGDPIKAIDEAFQSQYKNVTLKEYIKKPLVDRKYAPSEKSKPYDDLLFALVNDSMTVFSMYLGKYFDLQDETFIIMIFIQIDDRVKLKQVYGEQHNHSFDDARGVQRHPFQNALRVWAEKNRDPDKTACISDTCVVGEELENERPLWNKKTRDQLEYILMKESYSGSRSSIHCYGILYETVDIPRADFIKDITRSIDNHDLVDLYTSLDNWSMWIIILTTRRGDPLKAIDEAFKSQYKNVALKDYIK